MLALWGLALSSRVNVTRLHELKRNEQSYGGGSGNSQPDGSVRVQAQAKATTLRRFSRLFPSVAGSMSFSQEKRREF